jgi:hypothetical protein
MSMARALTTSLICVPALAALYWARTVWRRDVTPPRQAGGSGEIGGTQAGGARVAADGGWDADSNALQAHVHQDSTDDDVALEPVLLCDRRAAADSLRSLKATLKWLQTSLTIANRVLKSVAHTSDVTRKRKARAETMSCQARISDIQGRIKEHQSVIESLDDRISDLHRVRFR